MAHRHNTRRDHVLLPAPNSKNNSDQGDDGSGTGGSNNNRQGKRQKVTAVACQPCQKRKSKCDGKRPICSSCQQKGRIDCVYDSTSDLRRTSALKQRIDGLQLEVNDLRDILLALCDAHVTGHAVDALNLINSNVGEGDFARTGELAQILRSRTNLSQVNHQRQINYQDGAFPPQPNAFDIGPRAPPHVYVGQHHVADQDNSAMSPTTDGQSEWSSMGAAQDTDGDAEHDGYANYPYQ